MQILAVAPYIVILVANVLYLYLYYTPELDSYQIFLFNFLIMAFAGIFLTLHINIILHRWLIQQVDKNNDGRKTKKQLIRQKVKQILKLKYLAQDIFNEGNQIILLKIYLGIVVFKWVISFIPGVLTGLLFGLYYQYKSFIHNKFGFIISKGNQFMTFAINWVVQNMPRHKSTHIYKMRKQAQQKLKQDQTRIQKQEKQQSKNTRSTLETQEVKDQQKVQRIKQIQQIQDTENQPEAQHFQILSDQKAQ